MLSIEGRRVPGIVFMESRNNMNSITHDLAQQLTLEGAHAKWWTKTTPKKKSKFIGYGWKTILTRSTGWKQYGWTVSQTRSHWATKQQ